MGPIGLMFVHLSALIFGSAADVLIGEPEDKSHSAASAA
jgi:hypothetical protein